MKLNWNAQIAAFISKRLAALLASEPSGAASEQSSIARRMQALPVYTDMGGALGFTKDGIVLSFDWQSEQVTPESDDRWIIVAAVAAAEHYPELRSLLPDRPPTATTCSYCSGRGKVAVTPESKIGCGKCWGLGWVESAQ